jgi:peptide/nickel transport system substrate-binding protein
MRRKQVARHELHIEKLVEKIDSLRMNVNRRSFLKIIGAAGTTGVVGLLAACAEDDVDDDAAPAAEPDDDAEPVDEPDDEAESVDEPDDDAESVDEPDDDAESVDEPDDDAESVDASGTLVMALNDEVETFENWKSLSNDGHPILRNIMESLVNKDPETMELVGELAVSWENTADDTWQFELREGVMFHDGTPFNAEAAAYVLNYTWDFDNAFEILSVAGPAFTCTAIDEYTLEIVSETPDPILPNRLFFSPISSMRQLQDEPDSLPTNPIGTGPYQFVEWARGEYARATINPDWWGHTADDAYGSATIENIEWVFRSEATVRASMIATGEANLADQLNPDDCDDLPVCIPSVSPQTNQLRLDVVNPVLADIRVREAMALAIDVDAVTESFFIGDTPASHNFAPGATGYNDDLEPYPYDMDRARELVEEAQSDGVPIDQQLFLILPNPSASQAEAGEYLQEQFTQIGLNVEIQILDSAQFRPEAYGTPRDQVSEDRGWIVLHRHANEMGDGSYSLGRYYTCDLTNDSVYCNEEIDEAYDEAVQLFGDERHEALREVSAMYYDEYPLIPISHVTMYYGITEDLDWTPRVDGYRLVKEMSFR